MGLTDEAKALEMGELLLNGISRHCPITIRLETPTHYEVELSVANGAHREWLSIEKRTGRFRYSRYWPNGSAEPMWFDFRR